ncbi:MAG: hypothetical protein ACFB0G_23020 [Leptolyngbyaceae cyanobacterium]
MSVCFIQWIEECEMAKFLIRSLTATAAIIASVAIASSAQADEPATSESAYIPRAMDEIFYTNSGSYINNRSIPGQLGTMFGVGGFPEQDIMDDAYAVHDTYVYLLDQQTRTDPTIRVPDLLNPYTTSVQFLPSASGEAVSGSSFVFE